MYTSKHLIFGTSLQSNELILHMSGHGIISFNGQKLEAKEGTLRFLPAGNFSEYTVDNIEPAICIDIFFNTDIPLQTDAFVMDVSDKKRIQELFMKAFSIWSGRQNGYYTKSLSVLYDIFSELHTQSYTPKDKRLLIEPAVEYISANYLYESIAISDLAALCRMSESYLKKLFISIYGISPKKYIIGLKMRYAAELLSSGKFSVSDTAAATGYENVYYFSSAFKKYMGISPSVYLHHGKKQGQS